ncbi:MAG: hypothetical protein RLZZ444_1576 [Pseudomonadota bacterium]|jgi:Ca2+-binding RTX toxin-like protein
MSVNFLENDSTTQWLANNSGDTYVVKQGVYLGVLGNAISGTAAVLNRKFQIDGYVIGEGGGSGMFIGADTTTGGSSTIRISQTGSVMGENYGILAQGGDLDFLNEGSVTGGSAGLYATGSGNHIVNRGTISAFVAAGISANGANANIFNEGTISGTTNGIEVDGTQSILVNSGLIITNSSVLTEAAVSLAGNYTSFLNLGTVSAVSTYAILGDDLTQTVTNKGTITNAVNLGGGADYFYNRGGDMLGTVGLGAGSDFFNGIGGSDDVTVIGGADNDTYVIDSLDFTLIESENGGLFDTVQSYVDYRLQANFEGLVLMGHADLTGRGNSAGNIMTGNLGDNELYGLAGDDSFYSDAGADRIDGGQGRDYLSYGNTYLSVKVNLMTGKGMGGEAEGDRYFSIEDLLGSARSDVLIGSNAANYLDGYYGKSDVLTGNGGKDVFNFRAGEPVNHVTITDFVARTDKIDLHEMNNLYFIDTLAEVKALSHNDGDNLVIDFSSLQDHTTLTLLGVHKADLSAGDFIFV